MILAAIPFLLSVSVRRGREDARGYVYVRDGQDIAYERIREQEQ